MLHELKQLSTEDLLRIAATTENEAAFSQTVGELVMRYRNLVYSQTRYICSHDPSLTDDVFQNTFLRLFAWLRQRRGKPPLHSFAGLLRVFARRTAIDMLRKEKRVVNPPEPAKELGVDMVLYARSLLESLEGVNREVIQLSFFEGLSAKEIAVRLGLTAGNVRVLRYRALEQIRQRQALDELANTVDPL